MIAYELPDGVDRADVIHYVEEVRGDIKKKAEIVDVGPHPAALKEKLKDGFILYTTISDQSKLLRLATRQLGWTVSGGFFHFRDVSTPAAELRWVLVGKNPYGRGFCAIFAAGSNRELVGINGLWQGSSSYHVFQKGQLLREGFYDEHFVTRERVSIKAVRKDVNEFFSKLWRDHPEPLPNVSQTDFRELQKQSIAGVNARATNGEIAMEDLASLLYYAAARLHDGHTSLFWETPLNEWNTRNRRFPAFQLRYDNGRFVIASAKDQTIVGAELVAVNGTAVLEFLRPILDRSSGELASFRASRFLKNEPFWYYLTNLFGEAPSFQTTVRGTDGQSRDVTVETLNHFDYQRWREKNPVFEPNREGIGVEFLDSGATAHFQYPSFRAGREERKKIDGAFQELSTKGSRNLIVDLRGNTGGESSMATYLARYLYSGKFRPISKIKFNVSPDAVSHLPLWARALIIWNGKSISHSIAEKEGNKPKTFFAGRIFVLTDNGSFSMATEFAAMVRAYRMGTLVRYETGGVPITFAGPHGFLLRNSKIPCGIAWLQVFPAKPQSGDDQHGVVPDVPLNDQMLAEYQNQKDSVLAFTLRYIQTHSN